MIGRKPGIRTSLDKIELIRKLTVKNKMSRNKIAKQVGVSPKTVYNIQKAFDII